MKLFFSGNHDCLIYSESFLYVFYFFFLNMALRYFLKILNFLLLIFDFSVYLSDHHSLECFLYNLGTPINYLMVERLKYVCDFNSYIEINTKIITNIL